MTVIIARDFRIFKLLRWFLWYMTTAPSRGLRSEVYVIDQGYQNWYSGL